MKGTGGRGQGTRAERALRANRFDALNRAGAAKPHGTRGRYRSGCKCLLCRAANSRYATARAAAQKRGEDAALVSAAPARAHLLKLADEGIGCPAAAAEAGCSKTTIWDIRRGWKKRIRRTTEKKILALTAADGAFVAAGPTWRRIAELRREGGFTQAEIARRLGYKTPELKFARGRILQRTAAMIERFWRKYMVEDRG